MAFSDVSFDTAQQVIKNSTDTTNATPAGSAIVGIVPFVFVANASADVTDIGTAGLVECDGKRIGGGRDQRRRRRSDHPLAEDWPHAGKAAFEVVILDAGDQPAIGIVGEGGEIRPAMGFAVFGGLRIGRAEGLLVELLKNRRGDGEDESRRMKASLR